MTTDKFRLGLDEIIMDFRSIKNVTKSLFTIF